MDFKDPQRIGADVLVIGGGAAGMRAAIEAKEHGLDVILVSLSKVGFKNNSAISKAIFAASGILKESGDSPDVHGEDTVEAGRFINNRRLVDTMTQGVRQQFYDLQEFGAKYLEKNGKPFIDDVPGHSYRRQILFESRRGICFTVPMRKSALNRGVRFKEGVLITKLLKNGKRIVGAFGMDKAGQCLIFQTKATILATGGAGGIYLRTNNANGISGDGYALAYEAGAVLRDMEFVQFYPTSEGQTGRRLVLYEPLVRRGLTLRNALGEEILEKYGMRKNTKITRDVMARAVMMEILGGRGIDGYLLLGAEVKPRAAGNSSTERRFNKKRPEERKVAPTTHFFMGGVKINEKSATGVEGLYAAGEVCGGLHGANRLAGNAIAETFVFGTIAGKQAASEAEREDIPNIPEVEVSKELKRLYELSALGGYDSFEELEIRLRRTMWEKVGIIRDQQGLETALDEIRAIRDQTQTIPVSGAEGLIRAIKMSNMLTVSEMVCLSALERTETRGAHYRTDFPEEDNAHWVKSIEIIKQNGEIGLRVVPIET